MPDTQCVVVDTNEWVATKWFATPIGKAFCDFISSGHAVLAIPEVLQVELEKHRLSFLSSLMSRASAALADLERTSGIRGTMPAMSEVEAGVSTRLAAVMETAVRLEISQEHARSALKRINEGSPPNGPKNQQAKDSLLWEACLELAETRPVYLVTRDSGFYLDKNPENWLATNLASEPAVVMGRLTVFPSLERFLAAKTPEQEIQSASSIEILLEEQSRDFFEQDPDMPNRRMTLKEARVRFRGFPGSSLDEITLAFTIRFRAEHAATSEPGFVEFKGECSLEASHQEIYDFQVHTIVVSYDDNDDESRDTVENASEIRKWLARRGQVE